MESTKDVKQQQVAWARSRGLLPDAKGYLPALSDNLFRGTLSAGAQKSFTAGTGSELTDTAANGKRPFRPAKMRALHSSAALAVNVFDHWMEPPNAALFTALGYPTGTHFSFERTFDTGVPGTPPTLDLVVERPGQSAAGVESKFTEWLTKRPTKGEPFKAKYFANSVARWARIELPRSQRLADAMRSGKRKFTYLHAAQLLKHLLGLGTQQPGKRLALLYLYFDVQGKAAKIHREEIALFRDEIGAEVDFSVLTYQRLFQSFSQSPEGLNPEYLNYLRSRYFEPTVA